MVFSVTKSRRPLRCHWGLWDALSARGLNRKRHLGLKVKSGEQLPPEDRFGKGIPFWSQKLGRSFRQACHPESASRSEPEFWDAVSAETSTGKYIPLWGRSLGRSFRLRGVPESASHSERQFRVTVSADTDDDPQPLSHAFKYAIQKHKTADRMLFFKKVHVPKLTKVSYLATVQGRRLPPTDSDVKMSPKTGHLPAWLDFGQLLVS